MPRGGGPGRPPIAVDPEVSRRVVEAAKAAASAPRRAPTRRGETRGSGDGANNSVTFSPAFDKELCELVAIHGRKWEIVREAGLLLRNFDKSQLFSRYRTLCEPRERRKFSPEEDGSEARMHAWW